MGGKTKALLSGVLALTPHIARADTTNDSTIVVTARRDSERISDVPLNVSVMTADDIKSGAITDLQTLAARVPGLTFEAIWGGANSFPILRGQNLPSVAGDAVGMFVDGVYQANRDAIDVPMLDLARIEVVHGPQSALFGHSTFAGLISYVPAEPTEAPDLSAIFDAASGGMLSATTMLSGPLDQTFKARVAASWRTASGTWGNRASPGDRLGSSRQWAFAGSIATREGSGPLAAQLSGRFSEIRRNQPPFFTLDYRTYNCGGRDARSGAWSYFCGKAPAMTDLRLSPDLPDSRTRTGQVALHLALDIGDATLRSDTAFYASDARSYRDFDGSFDGELFGVCLIGKNCTAPGSLTIPVLRTQNVNTVQRRTVAVREYTQELRLEGIAGRGLKWMAGAIAYWTRSQITFAYGAQRGALVGSERLTALVLANPAQVGPVSGFNHALADDPSAAQSVQNDSVERRRTLAAFASGDWAVLPGLTLRGEIRGTWQRLVLDSRASNFLPSFGTGLGARTFFDLTGRMGIAWQPAHRWLIYASHARGSRAGGINAAANLVPAEQKYEPETNWTSELGVKFEGDGMLRAAEITGYRIDWSNTQINGLATSPGATALILRNTSGIETWGLDLSARLSPTDWLGLNLAGGYTNPRFKPGSEDPGSGVYCGLSPGSLSSNFCTIRSSALIPGALVPDISGKRVLRAARLSWSGEAVIAPKAAAFHGSSLAVSLSHQGNVFDRAINGLAYGERTLLDARIHVPFGNWSLDLWGTNLTDETYVRSAAGRPPFFYPNQPRPTDLILGERRRVGLTLRFEG